jgi:hypothetical protein
MKKTVCSIALVAGLIPLVPSAPAQNYKKKPPKPTVQDYGPFTSVKSASAEAIASEPAAGKCGKPAGPCLFYGGDFVDPLVGSPSLPNGLANESTLVVPGSPYGAATWVPFKVPAGQTWQVTGLFTNNMSLYGVLDQFPAQPVAAAYWSINEGILPGSAGTVVASGTSAATITATGRAAFGLQEFTVQVTGLSFDLTSGSYWMIVVPLCTNPADPFCNGVFFLSDVEYINVRPTHAFGPAEPVFASFFDSPVFLQSFDPANGQVGACNGSGCDAFSAGVLGTR